jgi:hypothetical protein
MRRFFLFITTVIITFSVFAQDTNSTVAQTIATLVTSGQGNSLLDAQHNALRSALEQSFGVYISSESNILNDMLVKDEISAITKGTIVDFEILGENKISDFSYTTTLKVSVSLDGLVSFVNSKGGDIKFKGSNFFHNINQLNLNKNAEYQALINLEKIINHDIFDYTLDISESPINKGGDRWECSFDINENFISNYKLLISLLKDISFNYAELNGSGQTVSHSNLEEFNNYNKLRIPYYIIEVVSYDKSKAGAWHGKKGKEKITRYYLRNPETAILFNKIFCTFYSDVFNFNISTGNNSLEINPSEMEMMSAFMLIPEKKANTSTSDCRGCLPPQFNVISQYTKRRVRLKYEEANNETFKGNYAQSYEDYLRKKDRYYYGLSGQTGFYFTNPSAKVYAHKFSNEYFSSYIRRINDISNLTKLDEDHDPYSIKLFFKYSFTLEEINNIKEFKVSSKPLKIDK